MTEEVCGNPAAFRWQWVNGQTGLICLECEPRMQDIARALGCGDCGTET